MIANRSGHLLKLGSEQQLGQLPEIDRNPACSGFGRNQQTAAPDPNVSPTNYRGTLVTFLRQSLTDRSDFHCVTIAEPALKPVGPSQHYAVCGTSRRLAAQLTDVIPARD